MLLALDVGNSNTVLGMFRLATESAPAAQVADWRVTTPYKQTADEVGVLLQTLFTMRGFKLFCGSTTGCNAAAGLRSLLQREALVC